MTESPDRGSIPDKGLIESLIQREARSRLLIEHLPFGVFVFNPRHQVVTIYKQPDDVEPIPGLVEGEPPVSSIWGLANLQKFSTALDDVLTTGKRTHFPFYLPSIENGTIRHFNIHFVRLEPQFVLVLFLDYTEHARVCAQRLADARRESSANKQESLSLLAASIAHDVNNIFSVVLNTAEAAWTDAADDETLLAIDTIRDAVRRGKSMMRELMTFAGETHGKLQRIDNPVTLIRESSRLVRGGVGPHIVLSYNLPESLPAIDADPTQFWKIFFNPIKNAAEAMKDHPGEIRVTARAFEMTPERAETFTTPYTPSSGAGVLFTISDNGPGIPAALLRRIFDPYTSTKSVTRGLGLAIVNSIVEAHGGGIRLASSEGFGTTFEIFLPASRQASPQPKPETPALPVNKTVDIAPQDKSVLIIEDEPKIVQTTTILLETLGYKAHAAATRYEAALQTRSYASSLQAILMDAHLGELETIRLLRAIRTTAPTIPVVIMSGSVEEQIAEMFAAQPYDAFLAKPFTFAELKDCLATLVRTA